MMVRKRNLKRPFIKSVFLASLFSLFLCVSLHAEDLKLPIQMEEMSGVNRSSWPVRGGIPFPEGKLKTGEDQKLQLLDASGQAVPMQTKTLAKWRDGSTKWLLLDTQVNLKAKTKNIFTLKSGKTVAPKQTLEVKDGGKAIRIDTGVLQFSILKTLPGGLGEIKMGDQVYAEKALPDALILDYQTKGPKLNSMKLRGSYKRNEVSKSGTIRLTASAGKDYKASVEVSTPMRVVIRTEGWYGAKGKTPMCKYIVRYTAFAGKPFIKIHHTFIYTEDSNKMLIRRIGFRTPFGQADSFRAGDSDESMGTKDHALKSGESVSLLSIGPDINHNGVKIEDASKKDVAFDLFTYSGDGDKKEDRKNVATGKHALGQLTVTGEGKGCTLTLRNFWKQHPNELSYSAKDGALESWVWANHGGKIIDSRNPKFNTSVGRPGYKKDHRLGGKATGWSKTHEILLNFHSDKEAQVGAETAKMFDQPVWPFVSAQWNCDSQVIPMLHPRDPKKFPGLEGHIDLLYAWIKKNQKEMHWDGFFDYGGVLIEFENHKQRYSGGPKNTWCWRDYAGFMNNDGQQSHHFFTHYLRSGRRDYMEMGEAYLRRIADVVCVHHVNPKVKIDRTPPGNNQLGAGHRHDMTAWHAFCTGYSMAPMGTVDYYYLTGDERILENMEIYADRCDKNQIGWGYGSLYFGSALVRIWEATGNPKWKKAYEKKLADKKLQGILARWTKKGSFRSPSDLYPAMMLLEQILDHKPTAKMLLDGAAERTKPISQGLYSWAYLQSKDSKYLDKLKGSLTYRYYQRNLEAVRKMDSPWEMTWSTLRKTINNLPIWYVKNYINMQQMGRYPIMMSAMEAGGVTEDELAKKE